MSDHSSIEWTDATWNPTRGCTKIAPGCAHCYAETFAERWRGVPDHPYEFGFDPRIVPEKLTEPLKWKKPRRIFVDSMSDLFHEEFPFEYVAACFSVMALASWHTFQVLTKRPERAVAFFKWAAGVMPLLDSYAEEADENVFHHFVFPKWADETYVRALQRVEDTAPELLALPNVWIGTSIANQTDADKNIPHLLEIPAAVRFLSCEPLLGPIDLRRIAVAKPKREPWHAVPVLGDVESIDCLRGEVIQGRVAFGCSPIDWVIVGGESGPGARPCNVEWVRSIVEQCKAVNVPVFVKQLGARPTLVQPELAEWPTARWGSDGPGTNTGRATLQNKKGGNPEEWPVDLRIRQFPAEVSA